MATRRPVAERVATIVIATAFAVGMINHLRAFVVSGPRPYRWVPLPLELFWSSLTLLDAAVVVLLATGRRRAGLALAVAIMVCDVAANLHAVFGLGVAMFAAQLLLQVALLGFLAGAVPFLWPRRAAGAMAPPCPPPSPNA